MQHGAVYHSVWYTPAMAKDDNTWLWLGLGTAAAIGVGYALTRGKGDSSPSKGRGVGPSIPPGQQSFAILDRTAQGMAKLPSSKYYSKPRDMKLVNSLVIHGMGFDRGDDPTKYDKVNGHFIILRDGQIIQLQPLERNLKASNGFNKFSVSVEFAGNHRSYMGKCYKPEKFGCDAVTEQQVLAGRYLIDYLINILPGYGGAGLQGVYAHRQSSKKKPNGPGPDIWYHVGEWASSARGMYTGADDGYKIADGRAIRDEWRTPTHELAK